MSDGSKWAPPGHRLKALIGRGGMGTVYRGLDVALNRDVAVKVLPSRFAQDENLVRRFRREAQAAAKLSHPRIVTVYSTGVHDGRYFIVMEFVDGKSLWEMIEQDGPMEIASAVRLVTQAADGLEDAHTNGLVHRDIKPHNLLLGKDGFLKITDFGLVHATEGFSDLTTDGSRIGTPRYMSPEACEGKPTTIQSDIYALGVVLYELLAGTMAYKAENSLAIMRLIVDSPFPDIRRKRPEVPTEIVKVIAKATAKSPKERYASCTELLADLRSFATSGTLRIADAVQIDNEPGATPTPLPPLEGTLPALADGASEFAVHFVKADQSWAEWIEKKLRAAGYEVESIEWDVTKGHDYLRMLRRTAENGTVIVSVVSPAYIGSIHRDPQWAELFMKHSLAILPVHVRKSDVGNLLKSHHSVDLAELDHRRGEQVLLEEAVRLRGAPRNAAPVPETTPSIVAMADVATGVHRGVFGVPVDAEPHFVGRDREMGTVFRHLEKSGAVTLIGEPTVAGMGVSQLAAEFAHLNKYNYDVVWWLDATRAASLLRGVAELSGQLGLSVAGAHKLPAVVKAVRGSLAEMGRWLIVLDDVQDQADIARYLPTQHRGHVIITTSNPDVSPENYETFRVEPLDREASIQYLFRATGERNEGAGASLAQAMGDIPLAMKLAAGYIKTSQCGTDAYLDEYLDRYRSLAGSDAARKHPLQLISAAVSLAADRLWSVNAPALELMKFLSYLSHDGIEISRIGMLGKLLPRSVSKLLSDNRRLQGALRELSGLCLLEVKGETLHAPALIQQMFRNWLEMDPKSVSEEGAREFLSSFRGGGDKRSQSYWCDLTVRGLLQLFPDEPVAPEFWPECNRLIGHAHAVVDNAARLKVAPLLAAELWTRIADYYEARSLLEHASGAFRRAIKLQGEAKGHTHKTLAPLYEQSARVLRRRGKLQEAREAYEHALSLHLKNRTKDYADIADIYVGMGDVAMEQRDLPSARQYYLRALDEDQKLKGTDAAENAARDHTKLGLVSQELGDLTAAWDYYSKSLETTESLHDENHPDVALAVKNMAGLLRAMGDLDNARNYYKRALKIDLELYDEHHPYVAQDRNNLGLVLQDLGFMDEAAAELRRALEIGEAAFGPNHPKVALSKNNVANILRTQGQLKESLQLYREAAETFYNTLGKHHEHTQTAMRNFRKVQEQIKRGQDKSGPKVFD